MGGIPGRIGWRERKKERCDDEKKGILLLFFPSHTHIHIYLQTLALERMLYICPLALSSFPPLCSLSISPTHITLFYYNYSINLLIPTPSPSLLSSPKKISPILPQHPKKNTIPMGKKSKFKIFLTCS